MKSVLASLILLSSFSALAGNAGVGSATAEISVAICAAGAPSTDKMFIGNDLIINGVILNAFAQSTVQPEVDVDPTSGAVTLVTPEGQKMNLGTIARMPSKQDPCSSYAINFSPNITVTAQSDLGLPFPLCGGDDMGCGIYRNQANTASISDGTVTVQLQKTTLVKN